jgi:GNAT superfamily N-acetyltransferase
VQSPWSRDTVCWVSEKNSPDLSVIAVDSLADDGRLADWVAVAVECGEAAFGDRHASFTADEIRARDQEQTAAINELFLALVDGQPVGQAGLSLSQNDNLHLATAELAVRPYYRRQGVGRALLARLEDRARAHARTTIVVQNDAPVGQPNPAVAFAAQHDYVGVLSETRSDLDLPPGPLDPVLAAIESEATPHTHGYHLLTWWDGVPDEWIDQRAAMSALISTDAPMGEMAFEEEVWDADRVREVFRIAAAQGRRMVETVAVHTATGKLAGYTILAVPAHSQDMAYQWDTLVTREHRGHRLGMALKAANLRAVRAEMPQVQRITTWNADVNSPMLRVNQAMGFRPIGACLEWQKSL